mmetsp:Transcript_15157/g.35125  ORF Transcript_15157/g.35125 Transcript_15157/m.35125 type:complete len:558 (-) Transcript_15157:382-2055(-)|eukprot:CAMPEP_0197195910 /NCGR_PEP_ID=MMETSP1423-20130617/32071_1 /TAXON_ID=476441 /ORGANISM="Pseudo-nitzschia heimii, Strain UNC1101" /LENGTH=557 /DNA_ID=CAMNT_0042649673 /DNA_START=123 /DNA_END=1796 /DNA_ORIENTATION=+
MDLEKIFLISIVTVTFVLLLVVAVYLLVYYQHPDDKNDAYFPKLVVIVGIMLAGATCLLLPLDVANNEGFPGCDGFAENTVLCGGLNMDLFWTIFFWLIPVWVFLMIPFSSFYYEADDGMIMAGTRFNPEGVKKSRILQALGWTSGVVVFVAIVLSATYVTMSETSVPVEEYEGATLLTVFRDSRGLIHETSPGLNETTGDFLPFSIDQLEDMGEPDRLYEAETEDNGTKFLVLKVTISTFIAALLAWMGWFLFSVFGGIGMASMPLDLLLVFKNRPRHMDAMEFADAQKNIRDRVNELVEIGELIKIEHENNPNMGGYAGIGDFMNGERRKEARIERQAMLEFKQGVFLLEQDVEDFKACTMNYENYNPLRPYVSLFLGICSIVISLAWIVHIIVYVAMDRYLFLNSYLIFIDRYFSLLGVIFVALFTIYLLFAAITGCFKFGLRVGCMQLHPMMLGKTYMSSFLFNVLLILLCAMPVVQFSAQAFSAYAANTTVNQIFNVQVMNLTFFGTFFRQKVFVYIFLGFSGLTAIYLMIKPKDTGPSGIELRDRLRNRKK